MPAEIKFPGTLATTSDTFPIVYLSGLSASPNVVPWAYSATAPNTVNYIKRQFLEGMPFWEVSNIQQITTNTTNSYYSLYRTKFKQNITTVYVTSSREYYTLTNLNNAQYRPGLANSGWSYNNPINALSASLDLQPGYVLKVSDYQNADSKYRGGVKSVIFEKSPEGYVGINTTNPTSQLTVNGDVLITGSLTSVSATFQDVNVTNNIFIDNVNIKDAIASTGDGKFLPLSGGTLTDSLTVTNDVTVYDIDSVKFLGEAKVITSSTSTITATNDYLKVELNGKVRYIRLFDLEKRPEQLEMVWDTRNLQGDDIDSKTIVLPICSYSFAPSGITIDWGDGIIQTHNTPTLTGISHTYQTEGIYSVTVSDNEILK